MTEDDLKKIEGMLSFHFGTMSNDFQRKIDLVVEGQQSLVERMDRLEGRMDGIETRLDRVEVRVVAVEKKIDLVEKKVDGIADDLSQHRRDTEAHQCSC